MEGGGGGVEVGIVIGGSNRVLWCEWCEREALEVEMGAAMGAGGEAGGGRGAGDRRL